MIEQHCYHHLEFHTTKPYELLNLFKQIYGFQCIGVRQLLTYQQWLLKSSNCRILVTSLITNCNYEKTSETINENDYDIITSLLNDSNYLSFILNRETLFNVALNVKSIESILEKNIDIQIITPKRKATDEFGSIEYICIKSCIGNVVHTLIDTSNYRGPCLPGFQSILPDETQSSTTSIVADIDHIAFALHQNQALKTIDWYENILGMKRFVVHRDEDPFQGFSVRVGKLGMRLFASEYWKCSETACVHADIPTLKFVFAESLIQSDSEFSDQITKFIKNHSNEPGVQHIGFTCLSNIKDAVRICRERGCEFLQPLPAYYKLENNGSLIKQSNESIEDLADLGILLDQENDSTRVLLQIFTRPIFHNDTFFIELIERRGATGFGSGNIKTLWKIVQEQMNSNV